jgi:uncharacterized repeat protein (TIGR02543 family)
MKRKLFGMTGALVVLLTLGLILAGCDTGTGSDNTGGNNTGGNNTGGDNTGGDNTGGDATYTVTFDGNGGSSPSSLTVNAGSSTTLPSTTRSDYTLNGWYTSSNGGTKAGNAGASYTPSSSVTLYAQWTQSAPTGVKASRTPRSSAYVTVNWNTVSGATKYKIYYSSSASGTYKYADEATSSPYDTYLLSTVTNYVKVSAVTSAGESALSSTYGTALGYQK